MSTSDPGPAPRPVGPYTPVVRAGRWLICSGQIALRDGQLLHGSVAEQVTQCVANLRSLLEGEGATLEAVVKTTVFLADIADYAEMNDAYVAAFGDHRPARSAFAVAGLPLGAKVEIEAGVYRFEPIRFRIVPVQPILAEADDHRPRRMHELRSVAGGASVLCQVPTDAIALRRANVHLAGEWRSALRDSMGGAMAAGYVARHFTKDGWYVLEPGP